MTLTSIKNYSLPQLKEMRKDIIKCAENDLNVFGFTIADIETEIEFRASQRFHQDDEQNPILDMGQSFIPKTAY